MINREATIRWKGYDPTDLRPRSHKRIWANCDICNKGRWISMDGYRDLCQSCSKKLAMIGHVVSEKTRDKIAKTLTGYKHTKEAKKNMSDSEMGHKTSGITKKKISDSVKIAYKENPESHKDAIENMIGGDDIVKHHFIYDHSNLSENMVRMTRSDHTRLHWLLQRLGVKIPHINIQEVL